MSQIDYLQIAAEASPQFRCKAVSRTSAARFAPALRKRNIPLGPYYRLGNTKRILAIYELRLVRLGEWLEKSLGDLERSKNLDVLLVVFDHNESATKLAGEIADICVRLRFGLALQCTAGPRLVFPPQFKPRPKRPTKSETGHVPSWLVEELRNAPNSSPKIAASFEKLATRYHHFRKRKNPTYDGEAEILDEFARNLAKGDARLYFPYDSLIALRQLERCSAGKKRDHFFHTFNNLLLGYAILSKCFAADRKTLPPDKFIAPTHKPAFQHPWESLWALTCLFHDPGYVAQEFWPGLDFTLGLALPSDDSPEDLPAEVVDRLRNSWQIGFREVRVDLVNLFHALSGNWAPQALLQAESERIDSTIGKMFFDGEQCGHSMVSGLTLINRCLKDKAEKGARFEPASAQKACEIAALSMVFHDEHARNKYLAEKLTPLSFESLPYAAILIFVDCLQDDRRDIRRMKFPTREVLRAISIDPGSKSIRATIDLNCLPAISWWPWKIAEYASALDWLNRVSEWKFEIDYRTETFR